MKTIAEIFHLAKPTKVLNEMRQLVEVYDVTNAQTNAVLQKLFLDKFPVQVHTILAGSLENDPDSLALQADKIMTVLSQNTDTFYSIKQSPAKIAKNYLIEYAKNCCTLLNTTTPPSNHWVLHSMSVHPSHKTITISDFAGTGIFARTIHADQQKQNFLKIG